MFKNCKKACANCCIDYNENCELDESEGYCTDTSRHYRYTSLTWQEYMQVSCRVSCDTCDLFIPSQAPTVVCGDKEFKYEAVLSVDHDYGFSYVHWLFLYKYPELIDGYELPDGHDYNYHYGAIDGDYDFIPPNAEHKLYGCAKHSCFEVQIKFGFIKIYDKDKDILIAKSTERRETMSFCYYTSQPTVSPTISTSPTISASPTTPEEGIFTITIMFSTSSSDRTDDVTKVVERSIQKILFRAYDSRNNLILKTLFSFCGEFTCDISFQVDNEEPDSVSLVANVINGAFTRGEILFIFKQTADHMGIDIFNSITNINIEFDFEYEVWPTTSPAASMSSTPTQDSQDCNVEGLFNFITSIFQPIIQDIANTTDHISDVLFGVESFNSSNITCEDKMFTLQVEIQTDDSPGKTSWELFYENGTIIGRTGRDTYTEKNSVYKHTYCLDTSCFSFSLFDSFSFQGYYQITVGDTVLA